MNLADAIRKAAMNNSVPLGQPEPHSAEPHSAGPAHPVEVESHAAATGSMVRLELFLTPEQLRGFFGAVIAAQHSVLTLKEAASHLRISATKLQALADSRDIPGLLVDGKWRFTRQGLDDWLNSNSVRKGA